MSELTMVAGECVSHVQRHSAAPGLLPIVINPPPPKPVNARMQFIRTMLLASPHPKQPAAKVMVETEKQMRRPKMSEKRPYSGWNAVLVTRYAVVNHDAVFAASKSELITAYVAAVMVPSNPYRKTFANIANSIQKKPRGGVQLSSGGFSSGVSSLGPGVPFSSSSRRGAMIVQHGTKARNGLEVVRCREPSVEIFSVGKTPESEVRVRPFSALR